MVTELLDIIRSKRAFLKIPQDEMAKKMNLSRYSYHNKENGKVDFKLNEFVRLVYILKFSSQEIENAFKILNDEMLLERR